MCDVLCIVVWLRLAVCIGPDNEPGRENPCKCSARLLEFT